MLLRVRPAELIKALRPEFLGLLNTVRLWIGRVEGPRVGMQTYHVLDVENWPDATAIPSYTMEAVSQDNVPFFSMGALDDGNVDSIWWKLGYEGSPGIRLGHVAGYARLVPMIDAELLSGAVQPAQLNLLDLAGSLPMPIVTSLEGLVFTEGQLFELRIGTDSGALYMMTRWGPEPQGGYHRAGPHTHLVFEEGDLLTQAATHESSDTDSALAALHHTLGAGAYQAAPGNHVHDAAVVTFGPAVLTDWDGNADPGGLDDAIDQLAERTADLEVVSNQLLSMIAFEDEPIFYEDEIVTWD